MRVIQPTARPSPPATRRFVQSVNNLATERNVAHGNWDTRSTLPACLPGTGAVAMGDQAPPSQSAHLISPRLAGNSIASAVAPSLIRDTESVSCNGEYASCMSGTCIGVIAHFATFSSPLHRYLRAPGSSKFGHWLKRWTWFSKHSNSMFVKFPTCGAIASRLTWVLRPDGYSSEFCPTYDQSFYQQCKSTLLICYQLDDGLTVGS